MQPFSYHSETKKNLRLKTNNKSSGEAQSANYVKSRTDYTTQNDERVNAEDHAQLSIYDQRSPPNRQRIAKSVHL
jgi:hypothetical protein